MTLYLDRCQVDTPSALVSRTWELIRQRRRMLGTVLDLGAGDGRFARFGRYEQYVGVEIDSRRAPAEPLPPNARLVHQCVFEADLDVADLCLGNPPYVRNQDLPSGWRHRAAQVVQERTGVTVSGLANAWQYFAFLALSSTKVDGLVALILPYEWVSRPSSEALRKYIKQNGWAVDCHRITDGAFSRVITTCSLTIIDKRERSHLWRYFEEQGGRFKQLPSPSGRRALLSYRANRALPADTPRARRGLSPGTQRHLVLNEAKRARFGLKVGRDVVACVTTLKPVDNKLANLTRAVFNRCYRDSGGKCWLIRTDTSPSPDLQAYLDQVPPEEYDNATCNSREEWWRFAMPHAPALIVASGFRGPTPKIVVNEVQARIVGATTGVYGISISRAVRIGRILRKLDLRDRIVAHSNGLRKLEVGQLQSLLGTAAKGASPAEA